MIFILGHSQNETTQFLSKQKLCTVRLMNSQSTLFLLQWYQENGIEFPLSDQPRTQQGEAFVATDHKPEKKTSIPLGNEHPAYSCYTLQELKQALLNFEGCSLKETAMKCLTSEL